MTIFWTRIIREPLVHFLLAGTAVYLVFRAVAPAPAGSIVVTAATIRALEQQDEELVGRSPNDERRAEILANHIDDEVLLREAYRRGYDRSDSRVRKRLLTVMRSTLDEAIPEPSRAQLEAYYRENLERFTPGEALTFDLVSYYLSTENIPESLAEFEQLIAQGADFVDLGERGMRGTPPTLIDATRSQVETTLGPGLFERISALSDGAWSEPLDTPGGRHFVRIRSRRNIAAAPFDEMESYVRQDYEFNTRRAIQQRKIDEMRGSYRVVVEED